MNRISAKITSLPGTVIHSLIIPLFIYVFNLYYRPHVVYDVMNMENASFGFNATILFCIVSVSYAITRWNLYVLGRFKKLSGMTILNMITTVVYPYGILWLCFERYLRNEETASHVDENALIRFYDEYKKLRLVIAHEAVMFIKSEDNYVQIHYLDKNRTRKFILRSSMRALEEDLAKKGLVRCHRSYFINPAYIKIVHRDESGQIVAELNQDGYDSIPISRKYQDGITKLL